MEVLIRDETISDALIAECPKNGLDRFDEVWDGTYIVSPLADNQNQRLVMAISGALMMAWDMKGLGQTHPGANVSDRDSDWTQNYRVPDVLCFKKDCTAVDQEPHWLGGPEFIIEIASKGDQALEKLVFYARVGTREVLVVERDPWRLTLFRNHEDREMVAVATSDLKCTSWIESEVVPVKFRLDLETKLLHIAEQDGESIRSVYTGSQAAPPA